ncbi:MAG: serine/threonine protein kinase, partial [Myxococcales bacterium]|nr:serine/threonine protein kinase [Myxococcales bacterium]
MSADEDRLRDLLSRSDSDAKTELETVLEARPPLRRVLANLALETAGTRPDPSILIKAGTAEHELPRLDGVDLGPTLGHGGMAIVHLGQQLKLDRAVAVKTLREDRRSPRDVERLLTEARITGRLEHPNIVPIHDIVRGPDGVPRVVLKLIEGDTWAALMRDSDRVKESFSTDAPFEWHLGVLTAVCRALSFAHSRGVIHRDVKPTNVMVGRFGEIYLVDWGIALETDGELGRRVELVGTIAYMAPEQLEADETLLGPWTDTYLLGATLY